MEPQIFLRRKEASAYLREKFKLERAPSTLAKLAVIGGGPPFRLLNRVPLYTPADLDHWVASKLGPRMHSTSDSAKFATEPWEATTQGTEPISSGPVTLRAGSDDRRGAMVPSDGGENGVTAHGNKSRARPAARAGVDCDR